MKPLFTVHAGEYLVASYLEKRFKGFRVWLPSKDTGVDLLVTNPETSRMVGLQVKFSKDFLSLMPHVNQKELTACGWWTLNKDKIAESQADFWVFVLYSFDNRNAQYVIIRPKTLLKVLKGIHGNNESYNIYLWVTTKGKCWETRDIGRSAENKITMHKYHNPKRDLSRFLSWDGITKKLGQSS